MSDVAARRILPRHDRRQAAQGGSTTLTAHGIASVEVHVDPHAIVGDWRELAATCPATPYQSPDWSLSWLDTLGAEAGVTAFVVVARDAQGRASALLPLGLQRQGALTVAGFIGAKDSNFNMGLFRPGRIWTRDALDALLRAAADSRGGVDLFAFRNQPHDWEGVPNPLLALPRQPSPSFAYKARLTPDPEAFFKAQLSRDSRKKVRQKMNRLRGLGPVSVVEAGSPAETAALLDAFVAQRAARNAASGLGWDDLAALRRFLERTTGGDGPVSLQGLRCGERIVATLAGLRHRGRFSGMLTSFSADPDLARTSPGELLLSEVMRLHCEAGFAVFDLGIGEARYKESYCPEVEPLFDSLVPVTLRGTVFARAEAGRLKLKRAIKQSSWAWPLAQRIRRLRHARGTGAPS